jgi:tetratricopeptide (TPR) repeat protein
VAATSCAARFARAAALVFILFWFIVLGGGAAENAVGERMSMTPDRPRAAGKLVQTSPNRIDELLQFGLKHHKAGDLAQAETCYQQVLSAWPDHAEALYLLGVVAHQAGHHGGAVNLIRRAIARNGLDARYFSDLGAALKEQGQLDEAIAALRQAIRIAPDLAQAHCNLGAAYRERGEVEEAIVACRRAIELRPNSAEAHANLGVLFSDQGKHDEAVTEFHQAIRNDPNSARSYFSLGLSLSAQDKLDDAVAACRQAIRIRRNYAEAHSLLGVLLCRQGKLDEAVAAHRHAIRAKPDYAEAHSNLGIALRLQDKFDEAVAAFKAAIRLRPDDADLHANLGRALHQKNEVEAAIAAFRRAVTLRSDFAEAHNNLGLALRTLGRLSESRAALEEAVRLAPRNAAYRRSLGEIAPFVSGDSRLAAMELMTRDSASLSVDERIDLHFALGKAYEDLGRHAEAFRQWVNGNALKRRHIAYDEAETLEALERIRAAFTPEIVRARSNVGQPSAVPIFIVGMPRSGTTLVEQILASHPRVFAGGELPHFAAAVNGMRTIVDGSVGLPQLGVSLTDADIRDLGARYLAETTRLAPSAARITDKMPANFKFVGLIHLALPNATIIHAVRDPVDTCLSCFSKLFSEGQNHTYDLAELGRYYRGYQALMAHWRRVLPHGRILDVRYEDVVGDLEGLARRVVGHCGLDWDPRCLEFHRTERPVRTASATQVRQPIYESSIGRSQMHTPFLGPLLAELGITEGTEEPP